ncbi:MAG: hypothetical protein JEZ08_13615 [Clostridiales bacterium]|nr:hypothetical protein [Clostridiales bacterium]
MKKRNVMIVAIVVAVSMLTFVAFAGTEAYIGYETFKDVLRNNDKVMTSGSGIMTLEVIDNNETIAKVSGQFSGDKELEAMNGKINIQAGTLDKSLELYGLDQKMYVFDTDSNDVYVGSHTEDNYEEYDTNDDFDKNSEAVLDFLVGDLKKEFKMVNDDDGTQDVSFELTKDEMPAIINLLTSLDHDDMDREDHNADVDLEAYPLFKEFENATIELPELIDNVEVEYLNIVLDLDENKQMTGMKFEVTASGLDAAGQPHVMTVKGSFEITEDFVELEMPSLENKNIIELPEEDMERKHR